MHLHTLDHRKLSIWNIAQVHNMYKCTYKKGPGVGSGSLFGYWRLCTLQFCTECHTFTHKRKRGMWSRRRWSTHGIEFATLGGSTCPARRVSLTFYWKTSDVNFYRKTSWRSANLGFGVNSAATYKRAKECMCINLLSLWSLNCMYLKEVLVKMDKQTRSPLHANVTISCCAYFANANARSCAIQQFYSTH